MRAATALPSLLAAHGATPGASLWRADHLVDPALAPSALPSGHATLDAELPGGGWPCAGLTELLLDAPGIGELALLAPLLAQQTRQGRSCVWVLPGVDGSRPQPLALPYAPALQAAGIDTAHCIVVQPATPREGLWALEQSLRATHLGAVIGWLPGSGRTHQGTDFRALRRLHLLAAQHQVPTFILRPLRCAHAPSPAMLRLSLALHDGLLDITVLKRRGLPLLDPVALQIHPPAWQTARVPPATGIQPAAERTLPAATSAAAPALPARRWSLQALLAH